jgi:uncharacterized protein (DUF1015 family)
MANIAPFRGVFYNQKKIRDLAKVVAPPYDVVSPEEQERLYKRSPYNFIRLDLNQEPDSYQSVAQMLTEWQRQGILVRDESPAIYYLTHRFKLKITPRVFSSYGTSGFLHRKDPAARENSRRP